MAVTHSTARPEVDVWFDPVCPYTWVTTRWLRSAARDDSAVLRWHLMSLAVLNEGQEMDDEQAAEMADSRAAGRLLAAVVQHQGAELLGPAYTALGERYHRGGRPLDRATAEEALRECGADPVLAEAMEDPAYDPPVRRSHEEGQRALGDVGGSPIVAVDGTAFFGPVLMSIPPEPEAAELFGAFVTLAHSPSFFQVQRPRSGAPDPHDPARG